MTTNMLCYTLKNKGVWTISKWGRKKITVLVSTVVLIVTILFIFNVLDTPKNPESSTKTGAQVKGDKNATSKPVYDTRASVALKEYLYVKYGGNGNGGFGVSWYNAITNITVTGDDPKTVKITTTLTNNEQGRNDATDIARAIMANGLVNIGIVTVSDGAGVILASKNIAN